MVPGGRGQARHAPAAASSPDAGRCPTVFQSYHARTDPDHFHFLPSGTVGIPPVVSGYLALAYRYAADHGYEVPQNAQFWSLIGDSEFREGSLLEAMPDLAERLLGNVTWIIDYNRQNLDGTRIPNERGLEGADCDRIERTALANGWRVIQVRHGKLRREVFRRDGGDALREVLEKGLSDYEFQMLVLKRDPRRVREFCIEKHPGCRQLVEDMSDDEVLRVLLDLGGHCLETMVDALRRSRVESEEPYMVIAHTLKGWGLECLADPANHSTLRGRRKSSRCWSGPDCPWTTRSPSSRKTARSGASCARGGTSSARRATSTARCASATASACARRSTAWADCRSR